MTGLRARLARLTALGRGPVELWLRDATDRCDGLCRPIGCTEPALTLEAFMALPNDRDRQLIELVDAEPPTADPPGSRR
jgi:hypothetical protein